MERLFRQPPPHGFFKDLDVHPNGVRGIKTKGLTGGGEMAERPAGRHVGFQALAQPREQPLENAFRFLRIPVGPKIL